MSLRCPICGKVYFYDRKICQECEDRSSYSKLIARGSDLTHRWNCSVFLRSKALAFGKRKINDAYIKIASEPKFTDFKPRKHYEWNCQSNIQFKNYVIQKTSISQLKQDRFLSIEQRTIRKDANNSLIYE